jgi:hypothetical protein
MPDGIVMPASGTHVWQPLTSANPSPMPALKSHIWRHRVFMTIAFPWNGKPHGERSGALGVDPIFCLIGILGAEIEWIFKISIEMIKVVGDEGALSADSFDSLLALRGSGDLTWFPLLTALRFSFIFSI